MALIDEINERAAVERLATIEGRLSGTNPNADFDGSVAGFWVEIDSTGLAVVEYKGKKYKAIRQGSTSLPAGSLVKLTYSNGVYFADW